MKTSGTLLEWKIYWSFLNEKINFIGRLEALQHKWRELYQQTPEGRDALVHEDARAVRSALEDNLFIGEDMRVYAAKDIDPVEVDMALKNVEEHKFTRESTEVRAGIANS